MTRKDLPETIEKIAATFESYWNSSEFEYYDEGQRERLTRALKAEKNTARPTTAQSTPWIFCPIPINRKFWTDWMPNAPFGGITATW